MEKPNFFFVRKHCHGLAINSMNEIWVHWFLRRLGQARGCQSTRSHVLTLTFLKGTLFHDFWVHNVEHNYKQPLFMLCLHLVAISTHIPCDLFYVNICKRESTQKWNPNKWVFKVNQKKVNIDSFPPSRSTSTFEINLLALTMLQQEKMSNCLKICDITSNKIKNNV